LRRAADLVPERIAVVGTGGISHWPATPDSGKINESWDREFLRRWQANDKQALLSYSDEATYRDAVREVSRSALSSASPPPRRGGEACGITGRYPSFRSAATIATNGNRMSHLTLEYSANFAGAGRFGELCRQLAQFMAALRVDGAAVFPPGGVRVRAIACEDYCIADGTAGDAAFVHAILKIGAGRSDAASKRPAAGCSTS